MALGFFRRWQKGIIIGLVALMLIGLVGGTALRYLSRYTGSNDYAVGESKYGEVLRFGGVTRAETDIQNLLVLLRLDLRSPEFGRLSRNGDDAGLAYALLLQEAIDAGGGVGESEIDAYLASIGLNVEQAEYRKIVARMDRRKAETTEPQLRAALARWLLVLRSFRAYQVAAPPSETALRKRYRDLNEKLTLRVVKVSADKYVDNVLEPTPQQVNQQFAKYRQARPDVFPKGDSFGFGYAQPARAAVSYMLVNSGVISRVTRPADRDVRDYFRENSGDFTKDVPVVPQPAVLPGATTKPDVVTRKVPMNIDEAWDQVVDRLSGWAAEAKVEDFLQSIQANIDAQLGPASADAELYKNVYARMIDDAQGAEALSKEIRADDIAALRDKTLNRAIPALARAAGLEAICYPWGATGEFSVSKDVRIPKTLKADGPRTLQAVLEEITRLVFTTGKENLEAIPSATTKPAKKDPADKAPQYPKLKWTTCRGFAKVLFPVGDDEGMTMLPITTGRTMLLDARELSENKDIGMSQNSRRGRGKSLPVLALAAKPLAPGQIMYAYSDSGLNRILWQVVESRAATVLKEPTDAVRKKVIADCRILDSYKTEAFRAADRIAKAAGTLGLEAAAKNAKLESVVTSPTSRITARSQRDMIRQSIMQQAFMRGMPEGVTIQEYMRQIQAYADSLSVMYRPHDYPPSMIEGVELQSLAASKRFVDRAFELVPADIEKPIAPGPLGPVITIPMPTARAHYVVQRIGYTPAVASDFKETGRGKLAEQALANSEWDAREVFFALKRIVARVSYIDALTKAKQQAEQKAEQK